MQQVNFYYKNKDTYTHAGSLAAGKCALLSENLEVLGTALSMVNSQNKAPKEGVQTCLFSLKAIRILPVQRQLAPSPEWLGSRSRVI